MRNSVVWKRMTAALAVCLFLVSNVGWAYSPEALYDEVWKLVNARFVNEDKNGQDWRIWRHRYDERIETEEDAYVAIETMLASLNDRYTRFLDPEEFAEEGQSIKARLFGIGIQIGTRDNKLLVISPIDDTPASRAGLKANDEILEIDGKSTQGMSVKDAADLIRGEKGTEVKLLIKREGKEPKLFAITRDEIKLKAVSLKNPFEVELPENIGYIKLSTFLSSNAAQEMQKALEKDLPDKDGYILDLRSNPGGLLSNAVRIADFFLSGGGIVSTVDRDGYKEVRRARTQVLTDKPLVVLIDGGSASASEILSGALTDNHRAILVGEKSFGKGLVQEINPLPGRSGVNITTQRYLTPLDIDINKMGIRPDIVVKMTEEDFEAKRDPQLEEAVSVLQDLVSGKPMKTVIMQHNLNMPGEEKPVKKAAGVPAGTDPAKAETSAGTE